MLAALCQSLIRTIHLNEDYENSNYNHDILDDGLWVASRNGINGQIIDPLTNELISMKDMISLMVDYCTDSLKYFNNYKIVVSTIDNILKNGTEADMQINEYNKNGFKGLTEYLIHQVDL